MDELDETKTGAVRAPRKRPEADARDADRPQAEESRREVKGDLRKSTARRQRIQRLVSRIRSVDQLRAVTDAVPEDRREAFLAAIAPHLRFVKQ